VEAVRYDAAKNWAFGLQWHPEDNFDSDASQLEITRAFIGACLG
jgi:putative glutamine amidotransferase